MTEETLQNDRYETVITTVVHCMRESYDIYIGRANSRLGLSRSIWSNPYHIGKDGDREEVIRKFEEHLLARPDLLDRLGGLKGKRLGCWCAPKNCHGHVLARYAEAYG